MLNLIGSLPIYIKSSVKDFTRKTLYDMVIIVLCFSLVSDLGDLLGFLYQAVRSQSGVLLRRVVSEN